MNIFEEKENSTGVAIFAWIFIMLLSMLTVIFIPIEFLILNVGLKKRDMYIKRKFVIGFWIIWATLIIMTGVIVLGALMDSFVMMLVPFLVIVVLSFVYNNFIYGQVHVGFLTRWFHLPKLINIMHENAKLESVK